MYYSAHRRDSRINQPDIRDRLGQGGWDGCLTVVGAWRVILDVELAFRLERHDLTSVLPIASEAADGSR